MTSDDTNANGESGLTQPEMREEQVTLENGLAMTRDLCA